MRENKGVISLWICMYTSWQTDPTLISPQEKILLNFHVITLLLYRHVWSGWLNIDLTLFFSFSFLWMGKTKEVQGGAIVAIL